MGNCASCESCVVCVSIPDENHPVVLNTKDQNNSNENLTNFQRAESLNVNDVLQILYGGDIEQDENAPLDSIVNDSSIPNKGNENSTASVHNINDAMMSPVTVIDNTSFNATMMTMESTNSRIPDDDAKYNLFNDFDIDNCAYNGTMVDWKFCIKSTYESRFCWINLDNFSINVSKFTVKHRTHKQAYLNDILSVNLVPPVKYRGVSLDTTRRIYLTIEFVTGGSIDFRFQTEEEAYIWCNQLYAILNRIKYIGWSRRKELIKCYESIQSRNYQLDHSSVDLDVEDHKINEVFQNEINLRLLAAYL